MQIYLMSPINLFDNLSPIDFIFFGAVILLLIIILVMVYIIKINVTNEEVNKIITTQNELPKEDLPTVQEPTDEDLAIIDINSIDKLRDNPNVISLSEYEREQEEQAIISYEELINSHKPNELSYIKEENITPDFSVKQVNIEKLNQDSEVKKKFTISLVEEENFLIQLQQLNSSLKM